MKYINNLCAYNIGLFFIFILALYLQLWSFVHFIVEPNGFLTRNALLKNKSFRYVEDQVPTIIIVNMIIIIMPFSY